MTSPDDEFDDFLRKRRPLFRRDDELEPPAEIDRLVLRRARDAIEGERPQRVFRAPSWGMPVALAATLVLGFTIFLRVGTREVVKTPEVTVQNVSRQVEYPAAAPPGAPETARADASAQEQAPAAAAQADDSGAVVVDLGASGARTERDAAAADTVIAAPSEARARRLEKLAGTVQPPREETSGDAAGYSPSAASAPAAKPDYRRDAKTWLAEIDRLRAAGETGRADAELAEYKREHRAYAGAPDR